MPTLQQLRYLAAVAEERHFRRAAEACGVTQPTLSAQLKELESKLGAELVERSRSQVMLTPVGQAVAERARRVLADVAEIRAISVSMRTRFETTLRAGVVRSVGSYFLPLIVPDLHSTHPKLGLFIREDDPETLLRALQNGALDLLFFPMPMSRAGFETAPLFREPIVVVMPSDHRLAAEAEVDVEMLQGETVLSLDAENRLSEKVRQLCEDYGARVAREYEGASLDIVRHMVAMGMGISLMPALYAKSEVAHQDIVVSRPFSSKPPSITIGMVWRASAARQDEFRLLAQLIGEILKRRSLEVTVLA